MNDNGVINKVNGNGIGNESQALDNDRHDEALSFVEENAVSNQETGSQLRYAPLLSQQDIANLETRIRQIIEQTISKQNQVQSTLYRTKNNEFEKTVIKYLEWLCNGISYKDETNTYYVKSKLFQNQDNTAQKLDSLIKEIQSLQQTIERQSKVIAEQASIIKKQHERIIQYENDVMYKTQKDLILELIGIADQLRYTLSDYANQKDYDSLYSSIKDMREWVDGSLQTIGVRKFENKVSDELDRKKQEVVEIQDTDNGNEDGKFKSILPGYIWTIPMVGNEDKTERTNSPQTYEFIIRPEQVAHLKFKPLEKNVETSF